MFKPLKGIKVQDITLQFIEKEFGVRVAKICDGLTKISGVLSPSYY